MKKRCASLCVVLRVAAQDGARALHDVGFESAADLAEADATDISAALYDAAAFDPSAAFADAAAARLAACIIADATKTAAREAALPIDDSGGGGDDDDESAARDSDEDSAPDPDLPEADALHLYRIAREAITNGVRHAEASRIRVRVSAAADLLLIDFTDDGEGMPPDRVGSGRGTASMRQRAEELHGNIDWNPGTEGGTKVVLRVPTPPSEGGRRRRQSRMIHP